MTEAMMREALLRSPEYAQNNPDPARVAGWVAGRASKKPTGTAGRSRRPRYGLLRGGLAGIIRDEEGPRGYRRHLIGTQSQLGILINDPAIDHAEFHTDGGTVTALGKPTGVNEYNPEPGAAAHAH